MVHKNMPPQLRIKVRRYLEFVLETKQEMKCDEVEIFELLNENLENKLQIHLRGRIIG